MHSPETQDYLNLLEKIKGLDKFLETESNPNVRSFIATVPITEYVNDFQPELDPELSQNDEIEILLKHIQPNPIDVSGSEDVPIAAVDTSLAILGETDCGVGVAFRAAIVVNGMPKLRVTSMVHLTNQNKDRIYRELRSKYLGARTSSTPSLTWLPYRVANLIERIAQRLASCSIRNGIVLWDGSLTVTKETTRDLLQESIKLAHKHGNSVIAISKSSRLRLKDGIKLTHLLANERKPCLICLDPGMLASKYDALGDLHVVKFTPDGFSFRVDVAPAPGVECCELIRKLSSCCDFRYGYPAPLADAHIQAYFTRNEVLEFQAEFVNKFRPIQLEGFDVRRHIFGVFGI